MIKRQLFLALLSCVSSVAFAQTSIGIEGGISSGYLNTNISNRVSSAIDYNVGYTINIPFQYKIKDWLYIETDPGITQKNYFVDRTDSFSGIYEAFKNTYLQIPLALKYVYGKRLQVFADAGVYAGYWLSSRNVGVVPNIFAIDVNNNIGETMYNESYTFNAQKDNRFEFGWLAGIGVQYHINDKFMLTASSKFYEALSAQEKMYETNQVPQYNEVFTFSLGGMLSLK